MTAPIQRRALLALGLLMAANPLRAAGRQYELVTEGSRITFSFVLKGIRQSGTAPIATADLSIDPADLARSTADVSADIRRAKTGLIFVTEALKSPSVLDAEAHPLVHFVSTAVRLGAKGRIGEGAVIEGDLTLRGVTRPLRLAATLTRPKGSAPDALTELKVHLTGALKRSDYGATGFADLVADRVDLDIMAEIRAVG